MGWRGAILGFVAALIAAPALAAPTLAQQLPKIDRATAWKLTATIPVQFQTFHPQGMVRVGQEFFVSAVEIKRYPARCPQSCGGHDRDAGAGVGHLFRISADGALVADLKLGEGDAYHPGGLDYDGHDLWVPVAEYRPDSHAILYRVDPRTMTATEVLRAADHIGAVAIEWHSGTLHGVTWGGRRVYDWRLGPRGASAPTVSPNLTSYIDYQDCHHLGRRQMLCSGLATYKAPAQPASFALGGWEIVDLQTHRPVWAAPIALWAPSSRPMTQNPFFAEATPTGVRAWFMPDDDRSTIFVYEATLP